MTRIYQTVESLCTYKAKEVKESQWRTFGEKDQFIKGMDYVLAVLSAMQSKGDLYHDEMIGRPATRLELLEVVNQRYREI